MSWINNIFKKVVGKKVTFFNGKGFPPEVLNWETARTQYGLYPYYMNPNTEPTNCPYCNAALVHTEYDWWNIGNSQGQYMVHCYTCPNGHGYYCEWA